MASIKVSGIFTLAKSGRVQMQLTALRGVFIIGPPPEPRLLRRLNREWEDPPMIGYTEPIQCLPVPSVYHSPVLPISAPLFYRIVYSRPTEKFEYSEKLKRFEWFLPFFRRCYSRIVATLDSDGITIDGTGEMVVIFACLSFLIIIVT